jgi:hypothetical protein
MMQDEEHDVAIKVEVSDPWAEMLAFSAQKTMYVQSATPARIASRGRLLRCAKPPLNGFSDF